MYMRGKDEREEEDRQEEINFHVHYCLGPLKYKFNSINDDIIRV